jgi:hypothetical protein
VPAMRVAAQITSFGRGTGGYAGNRVDVQKTAALRATAATSDSYAARLVLRSASVLIAEPWVTDRAWTR